MGTYNAFPASISFTYGTFNNNGRNYLLDTTQNTSDGRFYEWAESNGTAVGGSNYGIEFKRHADGSTWIYANTDDNNNDPSSLAINGSNYSSSIQITSTNVTDGDFVQGSNNRFKFNITSDMLWTLTPGSNSIGSFQTANFDLTTVQQIRWKVINGNSPTSNANYYLFNESPGGIAKDTINIGSSPQAGASSTSTYQNPSGADFTGIWYVGYGQNATRVNLATYNFNPVKKVHCNFW